MKKIATWSISGFLIPVLYLLWSFRDYEGDTKSDFTISLILVFFAFLTAAFCVGFAFLNNYREWKKGDSVGVLLFGVLVGSIANVFLFGKIGFQETLSYRVKDPYANSPYESEDSTKFEMLLWAPPEIPIRRINNKTVEEIWYASHDLKTLPKELSRVEHLKVLGLADVKNLDLNQAFLVLRELKLATLALVDSDISILPNTVKELKKLEHLELSENKKLNLARLFEQLDNLPKLKELTIRGISSKDLPANIVLLDSLERISLINADVEQLPVELMNLEKLQLVDIRNTPVAENWWETLDSTRIAFKVVY